MIKSWFVGHKDGHITPFQSAKQPTKENCPYDFVTGPFSNEHKAEVYRNWFGC